MPTIRVMLFAAGALALFAGAWGTMPGQTTAPVPAPPVQRADVPAPVAAESVYGLPIPDEPVTAAEIAVLTQKLKLVKRYAERVYFKGDTSREWGTFCKTPRGKLSVHHVTANGIPARGPSLEPSLSLEASDFAFLTFDPQTPPGDIPAIQPGATYWIIGFPAGDTDGEVIRVRAYAEDVTPIGYWFAVEEQAPGTGPEGVLGGISGSCLVDEDGEVVAVVYANGFSKLDEGDTWALANPVRNALQEAQGNKPAAPQSFMRRDVPVIEAGPRAMRGNAE